MYRRCAVMNLMTMQYITGPLALILGTNWPLKSYNRLKWQMLHASTATYNSQCSAITANSH